MLRPASSCAANARVAYVTPSHQYPLGATMSAARRLQLLEWAHSYSAWIVEDDYDSEYRYESMPVASMQGLDPGSRVIYIGTFSKTLFPSLRLGYIVIPPALVGRFLAVRQTNDLCPSHLYQAALADFISGAISRGTSAKPGSCMRSAAMRSLKHSVKSWAPKSRSWARKPVCTWWSRFRQGLSDQKISARAAQEGLWLWPLSSAYAGPNVRQGFILGFGGTRADEMLHQVRRLRKAIRGESGYGGRTAEWSLSPDTSDPTIQPDQLE